MTSKRPRPAGGQSAIGYGDTVAAPAPISSESAKQRQQELETTMRLTKEGPINPDTKDFCGAFAALGMDTSWDLVDFKNKFDIEITHMSDELVTFDMIGIDPPLANAFRRILIAEVPTVAISRVTIYQNTGVIHDENLSHRLGLVPIKFEPDHLEWKPPDADFSEDNCVVFTLRVVCDTEARSVYSSDLRWEPLSDAQRELFKDNPPRPVADDILIAKLRRGQEIELECHCEKGIGRDHAKWSPVCTATYRLEPNIRLTKEILGDDAEKLVEACPMGVFDIEDVAGVGKRAVVANSRKCSTCRECITSFDGEEKGLYLGKHKDHYLFSIESVGHIPATDLFERGLTAFKQKCKTAKTIIRQRQQNS